METNIELARNVQILPFNRTNLEWKLQPSIVNENRAESTFNRTNLEWKRLNSFGARSVLYTFNRTNLEWKHVPQKITKRPHIHF